MHYAYFVPRNTTKLTTRGGTSPDGVEMTLIRERKSTHRLGTSLGISRYGWSNEGVSGNIIDVAGDHSGHSSVNRGLKDGNSRLKLCKAREVATGVKGC